MLKSKYELAVNSIYDLKKDRIENAIAFTKQVEREVPNSANAKTATDLRTKLEKEKVSFIELEKKVEKLTERMQEVSKKMYEKASKESSAKKEESKEDDDENKSDKKEDEVKEGEVVED